MQMMNPMAYMSMMNPMTMQQPPMNPMMMNPYQMNPQFRQFNGQQQFNPMLNAPRMGMNAAPAQ